MYFVRGGFLGSSAIFGGGFRDRIGLGFVDFIVQNLSGYWMDPIPILYQTALLELVFFLQVLKKLRSRVEHPYNYEENCAPVRSIPKILTAKFSGSFVQNRAPVRSILKILKKIALPCGACSRFHRSFVQNRAPVRSILEIWKKIALTCGASSKFHRSFVQNRAPMRSILEICKKIALTCGASSKFYRSFV